MGSIDVESMFSIDFFGEYINLISPPKCVPELRLDYSKLGVDSSPVISYPL